MGRNAPTEEIYNEWHMTLVAVTLFSGIEHGIFCFNYKTSYIHGTRTDVLYKNVC